jgi:hypothetical protein
VFLFDFNAVVEFDAGYQLRQLILSVEPPPRALRGQDQLTVARDGEQNFVTANTVANFNFGGLKYDSGTTPETLKLDRVIARLWIVEPMCNCAELPPAVADPVYQPQTVRKSWPEIFSGIFSLPDFDQLTPSISHSYNGPYQCPVCNQYWYVECAPEEQPFPIFAIKLASNIMPTEEEKASHKQFLSVLAHMGFSSTRCLMTGCPNFALNDRAFCHFHFPFL